MNRKAFKYRIYPTHAQETILRDTLETCRGVYNSLLHERTHDYEVLGKSPSRLVQQSHLDEKALAKAQRNASLPRAAVGVPAGLACKFDKVKNKHRRKVRRRARLFAVSTSASRTGVTTLFIRPPGVSSTGSD